MRHYIKYSCIIQINTVQRGKTCVRQTEGFAILSESTFMDEFGLREATGHQYVCHVLARFASFHHISLCMTSVGVCFASLLRLLVLDIRMS